MAESEEELLEQASSGSDEALSQLFERHGPAVRARIAHGIPPRWASVLTAEDVMQESYTDAFLDIGRFEPHGLGAFRHWLTAIAANNLRNAIEGLEARKRGGNRHRIEPSSPDESSIELCELLGVTLSTPSRKVAAGEACSVLEKAIGQLPEDYQRVVRLYDLEGRPIAEVAEALSRRSGAVFMLRARAHRALRQLMGSDSKFFSNPA